eukprot:CAMPEP_0174258348 /NCGR_PEP_ID=MMETSP0439-20130205/7351_1 /TAXON_ID=0 /ORGANISM="Stereomyxa ramosa, Strain Chinc5" /LENGTH=395 /DNA_ID=CAMNT_0015341819 /DNA_START=682 /DNA_END=1869 /DNA_ORIENTATION=-
METINQYMSEEILSQLIQKRGHLSILSVALQLTTKSNSGKNRKKQEQEETGITYIYYEDLEELKKIEKGSFGVVYSAQFFGQKVAFKRLKKNTTNSAAPQPNVEKFLQEISLMMKLQKKETHPNVVKVLGICIDPCGLIMEFLENGSLLSYLNKSPKQTIEQIFKWAIQVGEGMDYLHRHQIIHQDLALRNVLIAENLTAKVGDLGLSKYLSFGLESSVSSSSTLNDGFLPVLWLPPECWERKENKLITSYATDVWSFGVTLWEIFTLSMPYYKLPLEFVFIEVTSQNTLDPFFHLNNCPQELTSIISSCLRFNRKQRPKFKELVPLLKQQQQSLHPDTKKQEIECGNKSNWKIPTRVGGPSSVVACGYSPTLDRPANKENGVPGPYKQELILNN